MSRNFKELALLDFDGTIIRSDSIKMFCKFCSKSRISFLFNYYIYCKLTGLFSRLKLKHYTVRHFLKICKSNNMETFNDLLEESLYPDTMQIIQNLKASNKIVVVVSASFEEIIGDFVKNRLNCRLISNTINHMYLDINNAQKLLSVKELFPEYKISVAYGNGPGDFSIMNAADISYFRHKNGVIDIWKN